MVFYNAKNKALPGDKIYSIYFGQGTQFVYDIIKSNSSIYMAYIALNDPNNNVRLVVTTIDLS